MTKEKDSKPKQETTEADGDEGMKEIKFRVWETENKKMSYDVCFDFLEVWTKDKDGDVVIIGDRADKKATPTMLQPCVLMQYTGLKDKNGYEIYESDIIEIDDDWKSGEGERGEVEWDETNAMFRLFCYTIYGGEGWFMPENKTWMKLKIIGNIYENPELLKEK